MPAMRPSENEGIEGRIFAVTGGHGYVGATLCLDLVRRGARLVRVLDIRDASPWSDELRDRGVVFLNVDVTRKEDVRSGMRGADCVFHLASYGMSGKEMLRVGRVEEVNIGGTCNVLDACVELGVRRLVYASTYNVVFGGKEIVNGNESLPYFPVDDHVDSYSRTKSLAEQLVLKANGSRGTVDGKRMYTCAVRPAAIYGPGEDRHLPRVVSLAKLGLLPFRIGKPRVMVDWIYIDNLVQSLVLASMGLLDDIPGRDGKSLAAGQAYFVSDGSPVDSFEFLSPLLRSLDYRMPEASVSLSTALLFGRTISVLYGLLYPWLDRWWLPLPSLLPVEVYKVGVTHYFSYLKAKEELGYAPLVTPEEGMERTISYWREKKRKDLDGPTIYPWLLCSLGMPSLFAAAFLPDTGPLFFIKAAAVLFFGSVGTLKAMFVVSVALHVGEALFAWWLATKVDPRNVRGWFFQTLALGVFSLRYLLKRAKRASK